jgi:hypothetical protein
MSSLTKKYSTCILCLPCKVITELVNTIVQREIEIAVTIHYYYYQVTPYNTYHPLMLVHTSWIRISNKEWGNNMHLIIRQEHDKDSHLIDHPIKQGSTTYELHNMAIIMLDSSFDI